MRLLVRVLLVWLMVLALPVQGFAAAAMQHCAPMQQRQAVAGAVNEHAHHESIAVEVPGSAADADAHGHDHAHQPAAGDIAAGDPTTADHQCSVCAACCLALALPASAVKLPSVLIDAPFSRTASPALPSFVPPGLERPPRTHLA